MKGLFVKDIRLISSQKRSLLIIGLVAIGLLFFTNDVTFTISYASFVISMSAISTISYDEFDNGNAFLFTLPFNRKEYTAEKYIFSILIGIITAICALILVILVAVGKGTFTINAEEILMTALLNIPVLLVFQALILPFQLKYEGEKGRIAMIAAIGVVIFLGIFFLKLLEKAGIDLFGYMINHLYVKDMITWISIYIVSIVIWIISLKISEGIMIKKEF